MKEYLLNFYIWWYTYKTREILQDIKERFVYSLKRTNTLAMLQNVGRPFYGDTSKSGLIVSIFIRFFWSLFGLIFSLIYIIPFFLYFLGYLVLPFTFIFGILILITA